MNFEKKSRKKQSLKAGESAAHFLLVDGYNIIFAWENLQKLAAESLYLARDELIHTLINYSGHREETVVLVFDAHESREAPSISEKAGIWVIFTAFSETADEYIEKTVRRLAKSDKVTVATSDGLEQMIIIGYGANRITARDLEKEVMEQARKTKGIMDAKKPVKNNLFMDNLDPEMAKFFEDLRRKG